MLNNKPNKNSLATFDSLELVANTPYIDFHYNKSTKDYTSRIIETSEGIIDIQAVLKQKGYFTPKSNDDFIFTNDSGYPMLSIGSSNIGCLLACPGHKINLVWNGGLQRMYFWMDGTQLGYLNILK